MFSFLQIFYDPAPVFANVRKRGAWVAPLVAVALLIAAFSYYVTHTIGIENITRRVFEQNTFIASRVPPAQREEIIQKSATPAAVVRSAIFAAVGVVVVTLIISSLLLGMLSIMDRKPQFSQVLGTVAWSGFPFVVITCLMGVLVLYFSKDPTELNPETLMATNLGAFLEKSSTGAFLYSLASSLDILTIGRILLLGFGISKVFDVTFGKATMLVMCMWLVWVLLRGGVAAAIGM